MLNDLKSAVDVNNEIVQHILKDIDNVFDNLTHQSKGNIRPIRPNRL